ncbi:MAG: BlaI/MecI/CopY family transcriptional regulator [Gemmatimonadota bacterium]
MSRARPHPTDAELQLLRVLWTRGPSTVREVHESLGPESTTAYTTSLKLLQNLHGKGLVARDESSRQHIYRATGGEASTVQGVVRHLIDRSFEGSAASLAMHALGAKRTSPEELSRLKALIAELEKRERRR